MGYTPAGPDNEAIRAIRDAIAQSARQTQTVKNLTWLIAAFTLISTLAVIISLVQQVYN